MSRVTIRTTNDRAHVEAAHALDRKRLLAAVNAVESAGFPSSVTRSVRNAAQRTLKNWEKELKAARA